MRREKIMILFVICLTGFCIVQFSLLEYSLHTPLRSPLTQNKINPHLEPRRDIGGEVKNIRESDQRTLFQKRALEEEIVNEKIEEVEVREVEERVEKRDEEGKEEKEREDIEKTGEIEIEEEMKNEQKEEEEIDEGNEELEEVIEECIIGDRVEYHEAMIGTALEMCIELKAKKITIVKTTRYDMRGWINEHSARFRPYIPFIHWIEPYHSKLPKNEFDYNVWDYLVASDRRRRKFVPIKNRILIYTTFFSNEPVGKFKAEDLNIPTILMIHNPELTMSLPHVFNRENVLVLLTSPHAYDWAKNNWSWFNRSKVTINWRLPIFSEPPIDAVEENIFSSVGSNMGNTRDYPTLFNLFKGIPQERDYDLRVFTKSEIAEKLMEGVKATVLTGEKLTPPASLSPSPNKSQANLFQGTLLALQKMQNPTMGMSWKFDKLYSFIASSKFTFSFTPKNVQRYYTNAISSALVEGVSLGVPVLCTEPSDSAYCHYFPDLTLPVRNSSDLLNYIDMPMSEYRTIREDFILARDRYSATAFRATLDWLNSF